MKSHIRNFTWTSQYCLEWLLIWSYIYYILNFNFPQKNSSSQITPHLLKDKHTSDVYDTNNLHDSSHLRCRRWYCMLNQISLILEKEFTAKEKKKALLKVLLKALLSIQLLMWHPQKGAIDLVSTSANIRPVQQLQLIFDFKQKSGVSRR